MQLKYLWSEIDQLTDLVSKAYAYVMTCYCKSLLLLPFWCMRCVCVCLCVWWGYYILFSFKWKYQPDWESPSQPWGIRSVGHLWGTSCWSWSGIQSTFLHGEPFPTSDPWQVWPNLSEERRVLFSLALPVPLQPHPSVAEFSFSRQHRERAPRVQHRFSLCLQNQWAYSGALLS